MLFQVEDWWKYSRRIWIGLVGNPLTPAGAKVENIAPSKMKCLTCMETWSFHSLDLSPAIQQVEPRTTGQPPVASSTGPIFGLTTGPVTNIDVATYHLVGVKDEQQTETVLRKETKTYPNESSARITPKVSITDSVTKSVTTEASEIKTSGAQAGIKILGFATIQGQIQRQLGQRYAVELQRTLTVSEEIQIEVPPHKAIELTITWKLVWLKGIALLGGTYSTARAEVPYFIPQRLTFGWRTRDVPLTSQRGN